MGVEMEELALSKYGIQVSDILGGDYPEPPVVENNRKEKRETYLRELIDDLLQTTFADLKSTIETVQEYEQQIEDLTEQLAVTSDALTTANQKAALKAEDDLKLQQAETLLIELEGSLTQIQHKSQQDAQQIQDLQNRLQAAENNPEIGRLKERIEELQRIDEEREANYQALADDVNAVLDGLEERFAELPAE